MTPNLEDEIALGRVLSLQLESQVILVQDPVITEFVNRVGQNLVLNSDAKIPFKFKVIDSDEINALSLPGGNLYIHLGLINATDEEAELAAVIAHEIAHVTARHAAEQVGTDNLINLASIPLSIFTGGLSGAIIQQAAAIGLPITVLRFSRKAEEEADFLGLQYMYKAGYDPGASVSFFEKLQARESARKKISSLFATHPQTVSRVEKTKDDIEKYLGPRSQYLITTSEFDAVKQTIAQLENLRDPSGRERGPTLRLPSPARAPVADSPDREPDPDAPPTLKRPQDRQPYLEGE